MTRRSEEFIEACNMRSSEEEQIFTGPKNNAYNIVKGDKGHV